MDATLLGKLIRFLRIQKDLTQTEMADALGVSVSTISKWETGAHIPDTAILQKLTQFFNITTDELFHPEETLLRLQTPSEEAHVENTDFLEEPNETFSIPDDTAVKSANSRRKYLPWTAIGCIMVLLVIGVFITIHQSNTTKEDIRPIAYRITEDEQCGTVYEVACTYSGDLETLSLTSPFIMQLSTDWTNDTSVSSDITIMKVSFYENE